MQALHDMRNNPYTVQRRFRPPAFLDLPELRIPKHTPPCRLVSVRVSVSQLRVPVGLLCDMSKKLSDCSTSVSLLTKKTTAFFIFGHIAKVADGVRAKRYISAEMASWGTL